MLPSASFTSSRCVGISLHLSCAVAPGALTLPCASCAFPQDKEVQEHFGKAPNERGVPMESPIKSLLGLLRLSHDLLVRLTVLRCVEG